VKVGRPELCAGAVAVDHGLLLLVKRGTDPGKGLWSLPGGRVESGESVVAAVVREFKEETGLEAVCGSLVGWVERMGVDHHFVVMDFLVTVLEDGEPVAGGDALDARWVALEELASMDLVDGLSDFLVEHSVLEDRDIHGV
jgi:ADP-ribose pyrophosphatase YjhB (NUDIX family)